MKTVATISIALVSVLLAGCAGHGVRPLTAMEEFAARSTNPRVQCNGDCAITVQVSDGCNYASLRTMELEGAVGQRTLTWRIDGPYKFSRENYKFGIVIRGDGRTKEEDPDDRIHNARLDHGDRELTIQFDKRNSSGSTAHTVTYYLNLLHERFLRTCPGSWRAPRIGVCRPWSQGAADSHWSIARTSTTYSTARPDAAAAMKRSDPSAARVFEIQSDRYASSAGSRR